MTTNVDLDFTDYQINGKYKYPIQDVKLYNEIVITARDFTGSISLEWLSDYDTILKIDKFTTDNTRIYTKYYPIRSSFFRLYVESDQEGGAISHVFKKASSAIQVSNSSNLTNSINISDRVVQYDNDNLVASNSMHTALFDNSGIRISDNCANALFVNPSNITTDNNCLSVGIFNTDNVPLGSTNGSLFTSFTNSKGDLQASTISGALFYSLSDVSGLPISSHTTVDASKNALHITLSQADATTPPLYVQYVNDSTNDNQYLFSANVDNSLRQITLPGTQGTNGFALIEIGIANETAQTAWLKIYDISNVLSATAQDIRFNIPVPALETREINMNRGVYFKNGVALKLTNNYDYNATGSSSDTLYVTGTCIKL